MIDMHDNSELRKSALARCMLLLLGFAVCVLLPGCHQCYIVKRTILREPAKFYWKADRKRSLKTYRNWANRAWNQQRSTDPGLPVPKAYEAGFKDGFVDFVYAGGTGQPPPVPPRKFWNVAARTPGGRAASVDWFAGYRHGADVARIEGYREQAIIPTSLLLGGVEGCYGEGCYGEEPWDTGPAFAPGIDLGQPEFVQPLHIESVPAIEIEAAEIGAAEEFPSINQRGPVEIKPAEVEPAEVEETKIKRMPSPGVEDLFDTPDLGRMFNTPHDLRRSNHLQTIPVNANTVSKNNTKTDAKIDANRRSTWMPRLENSAGEMLNHLTP